MKLSKETQSKIRASLLLKPEVRERLLNNWEGIDSKSQKNIIEVLENSFDLQDFIISDAIKRDENLSYGIKKQVQNQKMKIAREDEARERKENREKIAIDF